VRGYRETPERIAFAANPACVAGPSGKMADYVGLDVQICQGSRGSWPRHLQFANPEHVREFAQRLGLLDDTRDRVYAIYADLKNRPLGYRLVGAGAVSEAMVSPQVMFGPALVIGAPAVFVLHNHPSGDPEPSPVDHALAKRLVTIGAVMGVRVVDFMIIGSSGQYSFSDSGRMPEPLLSR
jgi:DNA repair protein RadC